MIDRHSLPDNEESLEAYVWRSETWFANYLADCVPTPGNLFSYHLAGRPVYLAGAVINANTPAVAAALRNCAQALTALAGVETAVGASYGYTVADAPPVKVMLPPQHKYLSSLEWERAVELALISRQPGLLDSLCEPGTLAVGKACGLRKGDENLHFIDLAIQVWRESIFKLFPALTACDVVAVRGAKKPHPGGLYVRCVTAPYLAAVRALAGGDLANVSDVFASGLAAHKEYWSSTDKLRGDLNGYVSLPLTSLAALAWDRGMSVEVESDYLPRSWVTGEVFSMPPTPE